MSQFSEGALLALLANSTLLLITFTNMYREEEASASFITACQMLEDVKNVHIWISNSHRSQPTDGVYNDPLLVPKNPSVLCTGQIGKFNGNMVGFSNSGLQVLDSSTNLCSHSRNAIILLRPFQNLQLGLSHQSNLQVTPGARETGGGSARC